MTVTYEGTTYYYSTNLQGDVVAILDSAGEIVETYTYDAWGNHVHSYNGPDLFTFLNYQPLRYRGYVYDVETGLYYLQSRYYNPHTGRFINADEYPTTGQGFVGNNMFAYCLNNPVIFADDTGTAARVANTVYIDDGGGGSSREEGYATPDEAALSFGQKHFGKTLRYGTEVGAFIVKYYRNGEERYTYTGIQSGGVEHVSFNTDPYAVDDGIYRGYAISGTVHTHPSTHHFSDYDVTCQNNCLLFSPDSSHYLVGDNWSVYKYNPNSKNVYYGDYIGSIVPESSYPLMSTNPGCRIITRTFHIR